MPMKTTLLVCSFLVATVLLMDNPKKECCSHFLKGELTEIEGYIAFRDSLNPAVSKVEVAWHLDHSLRTINEIHKAVKKIKSGGLQRKDQSWAHPTFTDQQNPKRKGGIP